MSENQRSGDRSHEDRQRTERAIEAYRERRKSRRGDDVYFGSAECLLTGHDEISADEHERRRVSLVEEAVEHEMPAELAALLYDIALDEGLDPVLAYELVRCGMAVRPPDEGVSNAPEHPTVDRYRPQWLGEAIPTDDLLRERALRYSFRRLRRMLEEHDEVDAAFRAYAEEPDVGPYGF